MTNRYEGVDPLLTEISLGYKNEAYIADLLLPTVPVKLQSGKHFIYDKGHFRSEASKRGAGARSREVTHNITVGLPYFCEDHSLKEFVTDEDVNNAPAGVDPYIDATENVTDKLLIDREQTAAALLTNTSNISQNSALSGTSQWSDYTNSNPIEAIRAAKTTIHGEIFVDPNVLMLSKPVYDKLIDHPLIIDRIKYSQLGVATNELLARILDVEKVIVGAAGQNTSVEGQADNMSYIWGDNALLMYVSPRIGQKIVTTGITYQWGVRTTERLNGVDERDRRGQFIRVGDDYRDQELIAPQAAYLFTNVV
jgi:hypothetical protein